MLRFIFAVITIACLLKITQDNAYVGFGIWLFLAVSFMIYASDSVDQQHIEFERDMLKTAEGRRQYYAIINAK